MEDDVQDVPGLLLEGLARPGEVVGEHRPVDQVAEHVGDPLDRHVADPALGDQGPDTAPASAATFCSRCSKYVGFFRSLNWARSWISSSTNSGCSAKKAEVSPDRLGDPLERVLDPRPCWHRPARGAAA